MSDDLVKRARDCANGLGCTKTERGDLGIFDDLADRIEELQAEYAEFQAYVEERETQFALKMGKFEAERDALAEKLEKAMLALHEAIYLLDPDDEDIAKETGLYRIVTTYAELTGNKND